MLTAAMCTECAECHPIIAGILACPRMAARRRAAYTLGEPSSPSTHVTCLACCERFVGAVHVCEMTRS